MNKEVDHMLKEIKKNNYKNICKDDKEYLKTYKSPYEEKNENQLALSGIEEYKAIGQRFMKRLTALDKNWSNKLKDYTVNNH